MKYKAAIFDLDGTLIDSTWVWVEIYKKFCTKFKIEKKFNLAKTMHMPPTECCAKLRSIYGLEQTVEELKTIFCDIAMEFYSTKVELKPGALEFLKLLKRNGTLICLATSNFIKISEFILKKHNIINYFNEFSYSDELGVNKKTATIYLRSADKIGVNAENCAVFEDIADPIDDIKAAKMGFFGIDDVCQNDEVKQKLKSSSVCFIEDYFDFIKNKYNIYFFNEKSDII